MFFFKKDRDLTDDDDWRRHERPDEKKKNEKSDNDPEPLDQVHVSDLDGLG